MQKKKSLKKFIPKRRKEGTIKKFVHFVHSPVVIAVVANVKRVTIFIQSKD